MSEPEMAIPIRIKVQHQAFDAGTELQWLGEASLQIGAIASFVGLVRDFNRVGEQAGAVNTMTLEHYPGMTEKALQGIAEQAQQRWSLLAASVIHRVGELHPGEPIVFVAAASAHRQDAFDACQFIMDILKTEAPFWKKEQLSDGSQRWVEARLDDDRAAAQWRSDES